MIRNSLISAACLITTTAVCNTLLQSQVPDGLRGRVMACYMMCFNGLAPFGTLAAGALAHRIGASETVMIGGGICFIGGTLFQLRRRRLFGEGAG